MPERSTRDLDRRSFVALGVRGVALASVPTWLPLGSGWALAEEGDGQIEAVVRPETLFAGIRKPLADWSQLEPRIRELESFCGDRAGGSVG